MSLFQAGEVCGDCIFATMHSCGNCLASCEMGVKHNPVTGTCEYHAKKPANLEEGDDVETVDRTPRSHRE